VKKTLHPALAQFCGDPGGPTPELLVLFNVIPVYLSGRVSFDA